MNLVDIDNGVVEARQVIHRLLHTFLKVAAILSASEHACHINLVDFASLEHVGHIAVFNALSEAINQSRFSYSRLTHV